MQKLSEQFRKGLRLLFRILGVSAIALVFQSCYGMPVGEIPPVHEEVPATEEEASPGEEETDI